MATVFLAEDLRHHRSVALKVLRPDLGAVLGPERFLREIETAARLTHPHILPLYESGEAGGLLYYVMPFASGESLRQRLGREKQLTLDDALRIAREVADALDYAHRHGVIHRDIKPENVLLEADHAVVGDFGIARAISAAGGAKLTETGIALGTPAYMSPEQVGGSLEIDGRSDIYSLGCVLYEMLAGHPPFVGPTAESLIHQHLTASAPLVSGLRPSVPLEVARALERALDKTPADRYPTALQFAGALELKRTATVLPQPTPATTGATVIRGVAPGTDLRSGDWRRPRWRLVASAVLILLALGMSVWQPWRRSGTAPRPRAPADVASVAVLPFDNLSGDPGDAYLSEGMTEEIIGQLAQVRALKVISRTSVVVLKQSRLTLPQIAETLSVRHILEGSVRRAGNRIRVAVQLVDAQSDAHVWAESYDRDLTDVFRVQEEIARQVSAALVTAFGGLRSLNPASRTDQPSAYEAYLRGKYLLHRRTFEGLRGALEEFQRAISLDSTFAPAHAGLASAYGLWGTYDYGGMDLHAAFGRAFALADRAIALDPELAEAYAARGYASTRGWAPVEPIRADFKRALELRPNSADVHGWYAHYLCRLGQFDEALAEAERAIELDPLAPGRRVGFALDALGARRYDLALREAQGALALEPGLMKPREIGSLAELLLGRPERCLAVDLGPFAAVRAMALHSLGRGGEAAAIIDSLRVVARTVAPKESSYSPVVPLRGLATYYAWVGNAQESIAWLERSYALSPQGEDFRVVASGAYDPVRNDPRFRVGLERVRSQIRARFHQEILRARHAR